MILDDKKMVLSAPPHVGESVRNVIDTMLRHKQIDKMLRENAENAPTITLTKHANKDGNTEKVYLVSKLREIDEQQNRMTLTGEQLDGFIKFAAARWLLMDAVETLEQFLRHTDTWKDARQAEGIVSKIMHNVKDKYSAEQMVAMCNVIANTKIVIYNDEKDYPGDAMLMSRDAIHLIATQAMVNCSMSCSKTRKQAKNCPLRRALCQIPGLKQTAQMNPFQSEQHCLFSQVAMEANDGTEY